MKKVPLLLQILGKYKHMEAFEHTFFRALFPDLTYVKSSKQIFIFIKLQNKKQKDAAALSDRIIKRNSSNHDIISCLFDYRIETFKMNMNRL